MAKKEHRKRVRELLANAIVEKALDMEVWYLIDRGCFYIFLVCLLQINDDTGKVIRNAFEISHGKRQMPWQLPRQNSIAAANLKFIFKCYFIVFKSIENWSLLYTFLNILYFLKEVHAHLNTYNHQLVKTDYNIIFSFILPSV